MVCSCEIFVQYFTLSSNIVFESIENPGLTEILINICQMNPLNFHSNNFSLKCRHKVEIFKKTKNKKLLIRQTYVDQSSVEYFKLQKNRNEK